MSVLFDIITAYDYTAFQEVFSKPWLNLALCVCHIVGGFRLVTWLFSLSPGDTAEFI